MQFSQQYSHAIALHIYFGAAACAGVCAHFAGWFVVCCGCVCCAEEKLLESCWELSEA